MTSERNNNTMDATGSKTDPASGAAQMHEDDANCDSGTSPPLTDDPSIHQTEGGNSNG